MQDSANGKVPAPIFHDVFAVQVPPDICARAVLFLLGIPGTLTTRILVRTKTSAALNLLFNEKW